MKHLWLLFIAVLSSCSIGSDQKGVKVVNCNHQVLVHSDSYLLGNPNQIALFDSFLVVTDLNNEKMLYAFHATSGKPLGGYLTRGQGPDEYLSISALGRWKNGMYLYDVNKRVMAEIKCKDSICVIPRLNLGKDLHTSFIPLNDDTFIASGLYQEGRFCLLKDSGRQKNYFMEYPSRDDTEKTVTNQAKSQAYSGGLIAHPSDGRFVAYANKADMLSFYTYKNDEIRLAKEIIKTYPDYKYDSENQRYMAVSRHNPFTYIWGCGTDRYVYLLYSGKSYAEAGNEAHFSSRVDVYNWEGEKVKTLSLDLPIQGMTISKDDRVMYAISLNPEPQLIFFDL